MGYADSLDLVGKNQRQRKVRRIWQDTREPDAVTRNLLMGLGYTVDRLGMPLGDYGWDINPNSFLADDYLALFLERKKLSDLRNVKHLEKQLKRMVASMKLNKGRTLFVVMIEYLFDTDRKRRWPEQSILNAELSIQLGGIMVTRCEGNDVAGRLDSLYKWSQKRTHQLSGGE